LQITRGWKKDRSGLGLPVCKAAASKERFEDHPREHRFRSFLPPQHNLKEDHSWTIS
jgi:hypothetical protein